MKLKLLFHWWSRHKGERIAWIWTTIILGLGLPFVWLITKALPPQIPLFYSLPWGEQQLAMTYFMILISVANIALWIANTVLASLCFKIDDFLGRSAIWGSIVIAVLVHLALIKIWMVFI